MADQIDLGAALDMIVQRIGDEFATFKTVVAEDESRTKLEVPAIVVQLSEIEPDPEGDAHTGQLPCLVRFEARVIMGHRTPQVRREVVKAAGSIAAYIHNDRMGSKWGGATIIAVEPDEFAPQADKFDIWRIEWVHRADIGPSYFVDDGATPTIILSSWEPETGLPYEGSYVAEDV